MGDGLQDMSAISYIDLFPPLTNVAFHWHASRTSFANHTKVD